MKKIVKKAGDYASFSSRYLKKSSLKGVKNLFLLALAVFIFTCGGVLLWAAQLSIPNLQSIDYRKVLQSTKIYDRTGEILLYDVNKDVRRTVVPIGDISPLVQKATIAIEDKDFYSHKGFKPVSFLRAVIVNSFSFGFSQGGSTITQQVVKNTLLTGDKTITRKLKEIVLSLRLEQKYNKDEILALYLNESPYGGTIYGVEEASKTFFGKSAKDITLAEAAYLAALPQAPTYYSPYGKNKARLDARKDLVLSLMKNQGKITEDEYAKAKSEVVEFKKREDRSIKAPHFIDFVKEYLNTKYGDGAFDEGGYTVITTLDYSLQEKGEEIIKKYALENEKNFNASNAALVAVDAKTGQILTMVGSRDYFDETIDGKYNIATAKRQPGSTFKPFAYATAFNKGLRPETVVFDLKTQFSTSCNPDDFSDKAPCYSPDNFDDKFRGPMTLRDALAQSINIPAVKTLYLAGIKDTIKTARSMGISTLENADRYGLTLVLGGGEVMPVEMVNAYAVFANKGTYNPHTPILEIKNSKGDSIEKFESKATEVLPKQTALQITSILSDNVARAPLYGSNSPFIFPGYDVAAKTGTTNDYRDVWVMGYTSNIAVGVWGGNNDNTPMEKKVAGLIAAPMWNAFMKEVLKATLHEKFESPASSTSFEGAPVIRGKWQGGESYIIDSLSGKLATEYTPFELQKEIVNTDIHTILHWVSRDNFLERPGNPGSDPQYKYWEYPVSLWRAQHGSSYTTSYNKPTSYDDVHTPANKPTVTLQATKDSFAPHEKVTLQATINSRFPITKSDVFINGVLEGSLKNGVFEFIPEKIDTISENRNVVSIVVYDDKLNSATAEFEFSLSQ